MAPSSFDLSVEINNSGEGFRRWPQTVLLVIKFGRSHQQLWTRSFRLFPTEEEVLPLASRIHGGWTEWCTFIGLLGSFVVPSLIIQLGPVFTLDVFRCYSHVFIEAVHEPPRKGNNMSSVKLYISHKVLRGNISCLTHFNEFLYCGFIYKYISIVFS